MTFYLFPQINCIDSFSDVYNDIAYSLKFFCDRRDVYECIHYTLNTDVQL